MPHNSRLSQWNLKRLNQVQNIPEFPTAATANRYGQPYFCDSAASNLTDEN